MTVGVYGLVAAIVKLDDAGLYLAGHTGATTWAACMRWLGMRLVAFAPWLMKALGVVGTVAMFMVGGGILVHAIHVLGDWSAALAAHAAAIPALGSLLAAITPALASILVGMVAGAAVLAMVNAFRFLRPGKL
jgi:hypothetical protein